MKKIFLALFLVGGMLLTACQNGTKKTEEETVVDTDTVIVDADQYVRMETSEGNITLKLYKDVPLHRHNFAKLVKRGYYDGQLFYRLVNNFTIQAGDPTSKHAAKGEELGGHDVDYTIPEEIQPNKFYHKRGALAMASLHKMKDSSGGHFYIVTGIKYSDDKLFGIEDQLNKKLRKEVFDSITKPYSKQLIEYNKKKNHAGIRAIKKEISAKTDKVMETRSQFHYTKEQKKVYNKVGGAAPLDGYYTVFGEVIEGMDVVTKIEKRAVNNQGRPFDDAVIKRMYLIDDPTTTEPVKK